VNWRDRILLISSSHCHEDGSVVRCRRYWTSGLTLAYLKAFTPPGFQVDLADDFIHPPPMDTEAGLVGITAMGLQIARAYRLAEEYRRLGKTVVMGGQWVSLNPEQALEHCDAVVKVEAEFAWPELVEDFRAGDLRKRIYEGDRLHDLRDLPRMDLESLPLFRPELMRETVYREYYFQFPLLVTRGCPHACDYCSVAEYHNHRHRKRPVGDVLRDIRDIRAMGSRNVLLLDDNPVADRAYAKDLFRAMKPLEVRWSSQCTVQIARDGELMDLAAASGCALLSVGLETIKQSNLAGINKGWALSEDYARMLREIRRRGIQVVALIMLGLDGDTPEDFDRTLEFLIDNKVAMAKFHLPLPYPGTPFYARMEREGRILTRDWNEYHYGNAVVRPLAMAPETAVTKYWATYREFFSLRSILRRFLPPARRNLRLSLHYFLANVAFRRLQRTGAHPYLF
jgi:radical SAM superfamily enzyme YgiQ (UPF0313 family)